jgi:hypothetical protein
MALQEKELAPLFWMNENLNEDARIFYLLYKIELESKEYGVDHYEAEDIGQWIPAISERIALPMYSAYALEVERINHEFANISKGIETLSLSTEELETFFDKYGFTHVMLTHEEYSSYQSYFRNYQKLYEDAGYIILRCP